MGLLIKLLVLVQIFSIVGCQKYSELKMGKRGIVGVIPKDSYIKNVKIMKWRVGPKHDQLVSKGIQIEMKFPMLKRDDMVELISATRANSWLVRLHRQAYSASPVIGKVFVPIATPGRTNNTLRYRQMKKGFIKLYYAAASISPRFEGFMCPAFNHSKLILDTSINSTNRKLSPIIVRGSERAMVVGRVESFGYRPVVVNGGTSLKGSYTIDISLYNSKTKTRLSSYLLLPENIEIKGERNVSLTGCSGFQIPEKPDSKNYIKHFRWQKK